MARKMQLMFGRQVILAKCRRIALSKVRLGHHFSSTRVMMLRRLLVHGADFFVLGDDDGKDHIKKTLNFSDPQREVGVQMRRNYWIEC